MTENQRQNGTLSQMTFMASLRSTATPESGLILLAGMLLAGCASPGPPRPPSLHLPQVVSNLTAERVGDQVLLHWTTPAKTTDGLNVETALTVQICRRLTTASVGQQQTCPPVRRLSTRPGPTEATDTLPPALTQSPAAVLEYRVELLNGRERSAGLSGPALAAGGAPPPPVEGLRAEATASGALLQWVPEDAADRVELARFRSGVVPPQKPGQQQSANAPSEAAPATVYLLAAKTGKGDTPFLPDAGGTLDPTARRGETYTYKAQRVRNVMIGGQAFELRSAVSSPVTVAVRDIFPPAPPARVAAIAAPTGIDLSWMPNTEEDLDGYLVYRADAAHASPATLIAPALVLQPAFHDTATEPGHTYIYTVVAVDMAGNRSAPSEPAREEMPHP